MKYSDCVAIYFSLIGSEYLWLQHVECVHWRVECRISSFIELRYFVYLYIKTFFPLLIIFNQNFPALLIFGYSKKKLNSNSRRYHAFIFIFWLLIWFCIWRRIHYKFQALLWNLVARYKSRVHYLTYLICCRNDCFPLQILGWLLDLISYFSHFLWRYKQQGPVTPNTGANCPVLHFTAAVTEIPGTAVTTRQGSLS